MSDLRLSFQTLNPYDLHKLIINQYVLKRPGDTSIFNQDKSRDKTDYHVIKENHKFLWEDSEVPDTWERTFAKKYYDKLFKEYCIGDLNLYKENKIGLRWRVEKEVLAGKGQFICGNKKCEERLDLRTWEVNFGYREQGEKKNALVKIRLCPPCSKKLNYHSQKREVKRLKRKPKSDRKSTENKNNDLDSLQGSGPSKNQLETKDCQETSERRSVSDQNIAESPWEKHKPEEVKTRDAEMEEYLQDLLL